MSDDLRTMITTDVPVLLGALCAGRDPWWDLDVIDETPEERTERHAAAVRVCRRCPVIEPCRQWGEKAPRARYGVWAGRLHSTRTTEGAPRTSGTAGTTVQRPATAHTRPPTGSRTPDTATAA